MLAFITPGGYRGRRKEGGREKGKVRRREEGGGRGRRRGWAHRAHQSTYGPYTSPTSPTTAVLRLPILV